MRGGRCAVVVVLVAAACGGRKSAGAAAADPAWFGAAPVPPGKLATLVPWMPVDDARPQVGAVDLDRFGWGVAGNAVTGRDSVTATAGFEVGRLAWVIAYVRDKHCEDTLMKAWGPGEAKTDPVGAHTRVWTSATTQWRAVLSNIGDPRCELMFELYRPTTAAFFTDRVGPPAAFAKLQLGMSIGAAHDAAPELVAAADDAGEHKTGWVGPSDCKGGVAADGDRIKSFTLTCEPEVMAVIEQAWGPGKPDSALGPDERIWHDPRWEWRAHAAFEAGKAFVLVIERSPDPPPSMEPAPAK